MARRPRTPADFAALTAEERITHALRGLDDCGDLRPTAGSLRRAFESLEQVLAEPDVAFLIEDRIDRIETMDDADLDALASRIGVLKDRVQDLAPFIEALTNLEEAMQSVCYEVRSAQEDRRMSRAVELAENAAAIQRYREGVRDSVTFEDIARGRVPGIDHLSVLDLPLATERGEPLVITHADFESVSSPRQPATTVADLRKAVRGQRTHAGSDARRVITVFTGTGRRRSIEMARVRVPRRMLAELAVAQAQPAKKVA